LKFLPKSLNFTTATNIYGNKVAIISLEKEPLGVVIENEDIVKTQKVLFNLLWKLAKHL